MQRVVTLVQLPYSLCNKETPSFIYSLVRRWELNGVDFRKKWREEKEGPRTAEISFHGEAAPSGGRFVYCNDWFCFDR